MERMDDLTGVLDFLDPAALDYTEWVQVGMGLKESGYPLHLWEEWSRRDSRRYHPGECEKKWETFTGSAGQPVTVIAQFQVEKRRILRKQPEKNLVAGPDWQVLDSVFLHPFQIPFVTGLHPS